MKLILSLLYGSYLEIKLKRRYITFTNLIKYLRSAYFVKIIIEIGFCLIIILFLELPIFACLERGNFIKTLKKNSQKVVSETVERIVYVIKNHLKKKLT